MLYMEGDLIGTGILCIPSKYIAKSHKKKTKKQGSKIYITFLFF